MKRFSALLLALALLMSLAACGAAAEPAAASPVELLEAVWGSYAEDEKFPAMGGDLDHANQEGPGVYAVEDKEILDFSFGIPADAAAMVTEGASLMHMMNLNSFTAGAFRLGEGSDREAFVNAARDNILQRQWLCGFPDTLVILGAGDCVITAFGAAELIENFKLKTLAAVEGAELLCEEDLAA